MKEFVRPLLLVLIVTASMGLTSGQGQEERPTSSVYGYVYGGDGTPLTDADVKVVSVNGLVGHAQTNANGYYQVKNVPSGLFIVSVDLKGFAHVERSVKLPRGQALLLDIGLVVGIHGDFPSCEISGSVKDLKGIRLADATVKVLNPFGQELIGRTVTDSEGNYKVNVRVGGQYVVYAYKAGFLSNASTINLVDMGRLDLWLMHLSESKTAAQTRR